LAVAIAAQDDAADATLHRDRAAERKALERYFGVQ
jgi:hypothetical protein